MSDVLLFVAGACAVTFGYTLNSALTNVQTKTKNARPATGSLSACEDYLRDRSLRRNFARRALGLLPEARDSDALPTKDDAADKRAEEARKDARDHNNGITTICRFDTFDIQAALERFADFPQPDGSFVHVKTPSREFAGFWLDGDILSVYNSVQRPARAPPFVIPQAVLARFSRPDRCFQELIALNIARIE